MTNRTLNLNDALYRYLLDHSLREHPVQQALREYTRSYPAASMQIAPEQGQFMGMLVKLQGAKRTLEIGVFTGYSALSVALALPDDGRIVACEANRDYGATARSFWEKAGVANKIDLRLGPAIHTLDSLIEDGQQESFDFAFIDADKANYDAYYERCLVLLRAGGLIAIDNMLWGGRVAQTANDPATAALQQLNDKLYKDERIDQSLVPIGDGLSLVRKR